MSIELHMVFSCYSSSGCRMYSDIPYLNPNIFLLIFFKEKSSQVINLLKIMQWIHCLYDKTPAHACRPAHFQPPPAFPTGLPIPQPPSPLQTFGNICSSEAPMCSPSLNLRGTTFSMFPLLCFSSLRIRFAATSFMKSRVRRSREEHRA